MDFNNQTIVITGAGSGMGAACARYFANKGAHVGLIDMNREAVEKQAKELDGFAQVADVSQDKDMSTALEAIENQLGPIRVCINCAGVAPAARVVGREGPIPLDSFQNVININLVGTFNTLRLAATRMSAYEPLNDDGERGVIINTASIAAFEGQIGQAAYSASKAGVVGMTLPVARELARFGIRVMTIAPGLIETPMMKGFTQEVQDSLAAQVPFPKRLGKAEEYAQLCETIITNPMLNGSVIRLDGAIRMSAK